MSKRKPRTVTGRVALRMADAIAMAFHDINRGDYEYGLMLCAAHVTTQGLVPADFDNDQGVDALAAIFAALTTKDQDLIFVTPKWRRVVIAARRCVLAPDHGRSFRFWRWSAKTAEARIVRAVLIPM